MSCSCMGNRPFALLDSFAFQPVKSFMAVVFEEQKKPPPRTTASQCNKGDTKGTRGPFPLELRLLALVACQKPATRVGPPLLSCCLRLPLLPWLLWLLLAVLASLGIECESCCARRDLSFAFNISHSSMRFTSPNGSGTMPKRPYVSRRAVPSSSLGGMGRANNNGLGIAGGALKWKLIKCALISSGVGLMESALFGVGLLSSGSSSSATIHSEGDAAGTSSNAADDTGGVHGVHAVAGRNFLQAKREPDIQVPQKEVPADNDNNEHISPYGDEPRSPLARGVSGLPLSQTPALVGGKRGHIECDEDVDFLAYWNDPQGTRDREFVSPFAADKTDGEPKYLTFQPDSGGWNNIRMSLETIFIIALALDRTLVLPPPMPLYLLNKDKADKHREFGNFYPLKSPQWREKLNIISTEEFLEREGGEDGRFPIPAENRTTVLNAAKGCVHMKKADNFCGHLDHYLQTVGTVPVYHAQPYDPDKKKREGCFVWDEKAYHNGGGSAAEKDVQERAENFCTEERHPFYFTKELNANPIVHFKASEKGYRLCQHFYGAMLFSDPAIGNYYKRFVRDYMRYHDEIYCAAGKVVKALRKEGADRGFEVDTETEVGGFSAMHIRRGDLQFKSVKFGPEQWWENTKEIWKPKEILYIATDERNATWFAPLKQHADIRFLDDYFDEFNLGELDPNYLGMIDTIIATHGRAFAGTFFSTFSGYIIRMRGYKGTPMRDSYYSLLKRKYEMRSWYDGPARHIFSHEWAEAWIGIDGDTEPEHTII